MGKVRAKIKFKDGLPIKLQKHIADKYGFVFHSRKFQEYLILEKHRAFIMGKEPAQSAKNATLSDLCSTNDKIELGRKCRATVASFHDPEVSAAMIRFRIGEMSRPLNRAQKAWVQDWIERNVSAL